MVNPSNQLGFWGGATTVLRGIQFIVGTPRAWPFAMAPALILVVLFGIAMGLAIRFVAPALLPEMSPDSVLGRLGASTLRFVVLALCAFAAGLIAAWCTPPLSGPALERIILLRERTLGVPERAPVSFLAEFWCGVRAQLLGLAVGVPTLGLLWLVTLLAPPFAVITVPAKLLTVAILIAWNLLDYPLSLRGLRLRDRLAVMKRGVPALLGFGAAVAVLFAVPFGAIVLLPAGVAAATEISIDLMRRAR